MAITTTEFASEFIDLLVAQGVVLTDATATKAAFVTELTNWLGGGDALTAGVANQLTTLIANFNAELLARTDFWFGTATGGPSSDGMYPFTLTDGTSVLNPSLAKLLSVTAKGDPGVNAATGFAFSVLGAFTPDELIDLIAGVPLTIVPANISGASMAAPTASTTYVVKKNGAAWGTVTFAAGTGAVTASFSSTAVVKNDRLELYAPHTLDATHANFGISIPGA